ncbi:unnamed protein product [Moneuplotes crassus]|uniref:Uncharacterized protein n=1 Tax=Euplotes crassus TaxID=5936 RepID=A0AAD1XM20_EUPCR|nr:unnamed protein product [Moneuplotes crassus]
MPNTTTTSSFCEYSDEFSLNRETRWKRSVIRDHYETSKLAEETLRESRKARMIMEHSLDSTRDTLNIWRDFEENYNHSILNLKERIKSHEAQEKRKQERKIKLEIRRIHLSRPTQISLLRKSQRKPIENSKIHSEGLKSLKFR